MAGPGQDRSTGQRALPSPPAPRTRRPRDPAETVRCVLPIPPCKSDGDLRVTGIERHRARRATGRLHPHLADDALVLVSLLPLDPHVLVEDQARQVLFRPLAERLRLLRCVDALEANLVLLAVSIKHGYRVAISHADHAAEQGVGVGDANQ